MTEPSEAPSHVAVTRTRDAVCKDCRSRQAAGIVAKPTKNGEVLEREEFEYYEDAMIDVLERGGSRSDRCPECRKAHRQQIRAFPVAYIDVAALGPAEGWDDPDGPSGPLGGLGPLPTQHAVRTNRVHLSGVKGLGDEDILALIERLTKYQVVILEAGTGTGKSTLAPFRLMNPPPGAAYHPTDIGPIIVTEPRVPATTEVAHYVGEKLCFGHEPEDCSRHIGPGFPVGYQCKGQKVWDESCRLIYVTDGTMINWIKNGRLAEFSVVVIDEAHERSANIDAILTLLHEYLPRFPDLKVIIASATIDTKLFLNFFSDVTSVDLQPADVAKQIGYGVPLFAGPSFPPSGADFLKSGFRIPKPDDPNGPSLVEFKGWEITNELDGRNLRADTEELLKLRPTDIPNEKTLPKDCAAQAFKIMEAVVQGGIPAGDVLVFLPTRDMVVDAKDAFDKRIEDKHWPVKASWLMRDAPEEEKRRSLTGCADGHFKVVFASNLAETSLTIPGIRYVVDSGLILQPKWDPQLASNSYPVVRHSQSGVRQRWGRVGRSSYGWVFPMYSIEQFQELPRDTPAGSTQTSLEQFFLKLAAAGVDDVKSVKLPASLSQGQRDVFAEDAAEQFRLESGRAIRALIANGAMTESGQLTSLGRELERSRLSTERTIALLYADRLACVPEVALALVALDAGALVGPERLLSSNREWPAAWCVWARRCHQALALDCQDDLDLVLRIYEGWETAADPSAWCRQWWVNHEALTTIKEEIDKLIDELAPGMAKKAGRPIDLRLGDRARAVLSRALTSEQYRRDGDRTWKPIDPRNGTEPVYSTRWPLIRPADHIVALSRERLRPMDREPVEERCRLHGLVNVLPWATTAAEGCAGPDPFDLMIRAKQQLRSETGELRAPSDPLKPIRASLPVGARLRLRITQPAVGHPLHIVAVGKDTVPPFTLPDVLPTRPTGQGVESYRRAKSAKEIYSGKAKDDETEEAQGDLRARDVPVSGTVVPPEDQSDRPQSITELEPLTLDIAPVSPQTYVSKRLLDQVTTALLALPVAGFDLPVGDEFSALVVGYALKDSFPCLRLQPLEPTAEFRDDPAYHADLEDGDPVPVVAGELVADNSGAYRVLHRCDDQERPLGFRDLYFYGPGLDANDRLSSLDILEGSRWEASITPWVRRHEEQSATLIDDMYERFVTANELQIDEQTLVTGRISNESPIRLRGDMIGLPVQVDLRRQADYAPTMVVPIGKAGIIQPGTRVTFEVAPQLWARRSGDWTPGQIIEILASPEVQPFEQIGQDTARFRIKGPARLSDGGQKFLLSIDRDNPDRPTDVIKANTWWLKRTSRHLGPAAGTVLRVFAIVQLSPEITEALYDTGWLKQLELGGPRKLDLNHTSGALLAASTSTNDLSTMTEAIRAVAEKYFTVVPDIPNDQEVIARVRQLINGLETNGDIIKGWYEHSRRDITLIADDKTAGDAAADRLYQANGSAEAWSRAPSTASGSRSTGQESFPLSASEQTTVGSSGIPVPPLETVVKSEVDVDAAVDVGCRQLGVSRDDVHFFVIREGKRRWIFADVTAVVRVIRKDAGR